MVFTKLKMIAGTALLAGAGFLGTTQAAIAVTCPEVVPAATALGEYRYMSFAGSASCVDYGIGSTADALFQASNPQYTFLAKVEEDNLGNAGSSNEGEDALDGILVATDGSSLWQGRDGKITWTPTAAPTNYSSFVALFKVGHGSTSESWFVFALPASGFVDAIWSLNDAYDGSIWAGPGSLSHTSLYGISAVPVPAAGFLLIGALGGLGMLGRRRRNKVS